MSFILCDNANQITNNIWLGNHNSAMDTNFLKENNIDTIINCTKNLSFNNDIYINKVRLPLIDDKSDELYFKRLIPSGAELIDRLVNENENILIHCQAGMNRSACILISYFILYKNYTFEDAYDFIKNKRYPIITNDYLVDILKNL